MLLHILSKVKKGGGGGGGGSTNSLDLLIVCGWTIDNRDCLYYLRLDTSSEKLTHHRSY